MFVNIVIDYDNGGPFSCACELVITIVNVIVFGTNSGCDSSPKLKLIIPIICITIHCTLAYMYMSNIGSTHMHVRYNSYPAIQMPMITYT